MLVFQLSKAQREQLRRLADEIAAHDSAERVSREQRFGAENRRRVLVDEICVTADIQCGSFVSECGNYIVGERGRYVKE